MNSQATTLFQATRVDSETYETREARQFEATSAEDIVGLARAYCESKHLFAVLKEAGLDGDLTPSQEELVDAITDEHARSWNWGHRDYMVLAIALALARRVAAGEFSNTESKEALFFIEDRLFNREDDKSGKHGNKATMPEILAFLKAIRANKELMQIFEEVGYYHPMDRQQIMIMNNFEWYYKFKHGLMKRSNLDGALGVARYMIEKKIADIEEPSIVHMLRISISI